MNTLKTLILSTALAGVLGSVALTPAVYAQAAPAPQAAAATQPSFRGFDGGFPHLICSPNAAAHLQGMLDGVKSGLNLNDQQAPLYDTFRNAALSAQTSFADACSKIQPPAPGTAPDLVTQLKNRQAIETARLDALNSTMPSFEAFYNSLTDVQKAALLPQRMQGGNGGPNGGRSQNRFGPGQDRNFDGGRNFNQGRNFDNGRNFNQDRNFDGGRNGNQDRNSDGGHGFGPRGMHRGPGLGGQPNSGPYSSIPQPAQPGANAPAPSAQRGAPANPVPQINLTPGNAG